MRGLIIKVSMGCSGLKVRGLLAMEHVRDTTEAWSAPGVTVANRLHVLAL